MAKTCIVIPCFNEFDRFPREEFLDYYNSSSVYFCFVNDGSKDNTVVMLNEIAEGNERIYVLDLQRNGGKAEAIRYGVNYILENHSFDYVGFFDADLATPLWEIDNLLNQIDKYEMVFGSRFKRLGATIERNIFRHYVGRVFATISSIILRLPIYDTQCGAKLMSVRFADIAFKNKFLTSWLFDIEMFFRLKNVDINNVALIKEVPLQQWVEKGGSKIKFIHMIKVPLQLLRVYLHYR